MPSTHLLLTHCDSLLTREKTVGWHGQGWCTHCAPNFQPTLLSLIRPVQSCWGQNIIIWRFCDSIPRTQFYLFFTRELIRECYIFISIYQQQHFDSHCVNDYISTIKHNFCNCRNRIFAIIALINSLDPDVNCIL